MNRWAVIAVGLLPLLVVAVWANYDALAPGGEGGHGGGMQVDPKEFLTKSTAYAEENRLDDGTIRAVPGEPIPITALQHAFLPTILRMRTGETYMLQFVSFDVIHGFSLQMGETSMNAVLMPEMMTMVELTPTQPGEYLYLCNVYCGLGHQDMSGKIIVEGEPISADDIDRMNMDEMEMDEEEHEE